MIHTKPILTYSNFNGDHECYLPKHTSTFTLRDKTTNTGTIRCKCTQHISIVEGIDEVICSHCYRWYRLNDKYVSPHSYSFIGFKCPECNACVPKLLKLKSHPRYYLCSQCILPQLNKLLQTRDTCNAMIAEINGFRFINKL